jgi:hypothetical protein
MSTFLGALLPFFGDFIALVGALAAFPLEWGLVHHMYLKVTNLLMLLLLHGRRCILCHV